MPDRVSIFVDELAHGQPVTNASRIGNLLCSSAVIGTDITSGQMPEDEEERFRNIFANCERILAAGGASMDDVVKMTFTLAERTQTQYLNPVWATYFPDRDSQPARFVQVGQNVPGRAQAEFLAVIGDRS